MKNIIKGLASVLLISSTNGLKLDQKAKIKTPSSYDSTMVFNPRGEAAVSLLQGDASAVEKSI